MSRRNSRVLICGRTKQTEEGDIISLDQGVVGALACDEFGNLWVRTASPSDPTPGSGNGAQTVREPLQWSENSLPIAATQATVTHTGTLGQRHVARTISASVNAVAVQGVQTLILRNGPSGLGATLWEIRLGPLAAGTMFAGEWIVTLPGSAGIDMTLEFTAAPAATNFNSVALTGYDVAG